jgi:hypothetical protein
MIGVEEMYICKDCEKIFDNPKHYVETHGFSYGPYEEWNGCPQCGGDYTNVYRCDCCNEWIAYKYVKIEHQRYCQDCYEIFEIGDED